MPVGLLGRMVGMTQVYKEVGDLIPVTVIEAGPCVVLQLKTVERDGYEAVQLGYLDKKRPVGGRGCWCCSRPTWRGSDPATRTRAFPGWHW